MDNEFHPEAFIRMGESLYMPGEIDKEEPKEVPKLKAVPKHMKVIDHFKQNLAIGEVHSHVDDPLWKFLNAAENKDKYYYLARRASGSGQSAEWENTLEPLGKFDNVEKKYTGNSNIADGYFHYNILFTPTTYSQQITEKSELYYTDEPPAAGSPPLTINDIPKEDNLGSSNGGKKTKKHRRNRRKNRKTKNKRKRIKGKSKK
jgi:hypothetical protein